MKKILITGLFVAAFIMGVNAQTYVLGGLNLANITKDASGTTEDNNILPSFHAGVISRFDITKIVDLEAGLLLTGKGAKAETFFTGSTTDNYIKSKFNPLYLEVPLNAVIKINSKEGNGFFLHAGPYVAMGIGGKSKVESKFLGVTSTSSETIQFNDDDPTTSAQENAAYDRLKRFDFGLNIGGGFQMKDVILRLNYGHGLAKINSMDASNTADDKNKYRTISLSIGLIL